MTRLVSGAAVAALLVLHAAPARGQLANPQPSALGMGENHTAAARGYSAIAWNPAALALDGNPKTSAMIGTVRAASGLRPITRSDLSAYGGEVVAEAVKADWLARIVAAGGQSGSGDFDVTWATLQTGRLGIQVASSGHAANDITPGVAELLLFGNADASGAAQDLDLSGSSLDVQLYTTFAAAYAVPFAVGGARLALGTTVKYTIGHSLAVSETSQGAARADNAEVRLSFPVAYAPFVRENSTYQLKSGGGFGVDVALGLDAGPWRVAAVAQNVYSSFAWDPEQLRYIPGEVRFTESERVTTFDTAPLSAAPASLRRRVAAATFRPNYALGAMYRGSDRLTLSAETRFGSTDGMASRPPVHAGGGLEYRVLPWLPLQLGAAYVSLGPDRTGHQLAGGLGLRLGSFTVSAAAARRQAGGAPYNTFMVGLLSHEF